MSRLLCAAIVLVLLTGACAPAPATPTATPIPPTNTPAPTATPFPTNPPLPTEIPTEQLRDNLAPQQRETVAQATFRTVHTASILPEVDVYLNEQVVGFSLDYAEATGQAQVPAGEYELRLVASGGRSADPPLLTQTVSLAPGAAVIAVLMPDETIAFFEENMQALATESSRVQVIHAIPDGAFTSLPRQDAPEAPAFPRIGYAEQSQPLIYDAGALTLEFENLALRYDVRLQGRRAYTFVLTGTQDNPIIIEFEANVPARSALTLVNLSQQIGTVDIYLDGELLVPELSNRNTEDAIELPVDTYDIAIYETDSDPAQVAPLLQSRLLLRPDDEVFGLIIGPANDLRLITHQDSGSTTQADETRITFISAVSSVPQMQDIRNDERQLTITYAQPTVATFESGLRDFEFVTDRTENDYTIVEFVGERDFREGHSYIVLMTGEGSNGDNALVFERFVGAEEPIQRANEPTFEDPVFYLINALGQDVELQIDGGTVDSDLPAGDRTPTLTLPAREHVLTVIEQASGETLYTTRRVLQSDEQYTFVLFGDLETSNYTISEFPVFPTQERQRLGSGIERTQQSNVRLINTSLERSRRFALAYAPRRALEVRPTGDGRSTADEPVPLPDDATGFTSLAIFSGEVHDPVALEPGEYDLFVYDANNVTIMAAIYGVTLDPGVSYEVVVSAVPGNTPFTAYLLPVLPVE